MSTPTPPTPTACEGALIGSQPWKRVHCNGCADAAALRERLAEAEKWSETAVTSVTLQSVKDRLYGEIHDMRTQRNTAEARAATAEALALTNWAERDELRGLLEAILRFEGRAFDRARDWFDAHPAIPEGTPTDRK